MEGFRVFVVLDFGSFMYSCFAANVINRRDYSYKILCSCVCVSELVIDMFCFIVQSCCVSLRVTR